MEFNRRWLRRYAIVDESEWGTKGSVVSMLTALSSLTYIAVMVTRLQMFILYTNISFAIVWTDRTWFH